MDLLTWPGWSVSWGRGGRVEKRVLPETMIPIPRDQARSVLQKMGIRVKFPPI
jgi:hypothetical protein